MSWVDHPTYFGPDRRQRRGGLKLFDRRRRSYLNDPPTLAAAVRRLKLQVLDSVGAEAIAHFAAQCAGVSALAASRGRADIANVLNELRLNITQDDVLDRDHRPTIEFALGACAEMLVMRAPRTARGAYGGPSEPTPRQR